MIDRDNQCFRSPSDFNHFELQLPIYPFECNEMIFTFSQRDPLFGQLVNVKSIDGISMDQQTTEHTIREIF